MIVKKYVGKYLRCNASMILFLLDEMIGMVTVIKTCLARSIYFTGIFYDETQTRL